MTLHRTLPVLAAAVLLAGCGGSSTPSTAQPAGDAASAAASTAASASAAPVPGGSAAANTSGAARTTTGTTSGGTSGTTTGATGGTTSGAGTGSARSAYTAPGTYTYDTSGTVTAGAPRDASGTATLTVDAPAGGSQHSLLGNDQGRTEQTVTNRSGGTYLTKLVITNPAFDKTFEPTDALLMPEPATVGRTWSWKVTSTDGKTTASVTARIARNETLTIGGASTPTTVVESTLQLTGDITYTAHTQTWFDPAHRLPVKDHTKGEGHFGATTFTTDITSVMRSTQPS